MPIYADGSTFPIKKFSIYNQLKFNSIEEIVKHFKRNIYLNRDYVKNINKYKNQHLFEFVTNVLLTLICDVDHRQIKEDEIDSDCIVDIDLFLSIVNLKIDLNRLVRVTNYSYDNQSNDFDKVKFVTEILIFTYKYYFVQLAQIIYCNTDDSKDLMNFKLNYERFLRYHDAINQKKHNNLTVKAKINFVRSYKTSCGTEDLESIKMLNREIQLFSNHRTAKQQLNNIIENNIKIDSSLSKIAQNRILLPFFKLITVNFFYKHLSQLNSNDPVLIDTFKKFRSKLK